MIGIETLIAGVTQDQSAPPFEHRGAAVHVVEIAQAEELHEQGIENRIDVIGRDVRDARNHDIRLPLHSDRVLVETPLQGKLVYRLGSPRIDRHDLIR